MQINSLQDLYETKIQFIADAEQQALKAYPRILEEVENQQLRQTLQTHMQQSQRQLDQVRQLSQQSGQKAQQQTCLSMQALIRETEQTAGQIQDPAVKDAFLIGAVQAMEHHEIAAYGTAREWALALGHEQDARLLENILNEEKQVDEKLTRFAKQGVNERAMRDDREIPLSARRGVGGAPASPSRSQSSTRSGGAKRNVNTDINRGIDRNIDSEPGADA